MVRTISSPEKAHRVLTAVESVGPESAPFDVRLVKLDARLRDLEQPSLLSGKERLKSLSEVEPEAEAEVGTQREGSSGSQHPTKLEWQELVTAMASVRGDVEVLQRLHNRSHSDLDSLRVQFTVLTSALPRVEAAVRHLCDELQGLGQQQAELSSGLKAEVAERSRMEDKLGERCCSLEAVQALLDEHKGATETAVEWLRQDLCESHSRLEEVQQRSRKAQDKRLEDLTEEWQSNSNSQKLLQQDYERLSERCDAFERLMKEQRERWPSISTDCTTAKLGKEESMELAEKPLGVKAEDRLIELNEEVASLGAQQQLHTLLLESLRRDVEWSEKLHRASLSIPG